MTESNAELIHSLCTEQADAFSCADDLLPGIYQNNPERILAACLIAHALDLNPATVMFGLHLKERPAQSGDAQKLKNLDEFEAAEEIARKAQGTAATAANVDWPKFFQGEWTDSRGTLFDKVIHGWNKVAKMPSVKADGTFRGARTAKKKKAKPASKAPAKQTAPADEQAIVDANQVLATFSNHVAQADTEERLDQISAQIELMGFTPEELDIANGWIAARINALSAEAA